MDDINNIRSANVLSRNTRCVSNTREVISGPADGQIESYASRARELAARALQLRSLRAPLDLARPCVLRTERRYCVSGRFNCDGDGSKADNGDTRRPYFHFRENAFAKDRAREEDREFRKVFLPRNDLCI